jgi:hypothetical protein
MQMLYARYERESRGYMPLLGNGYLAQAADDDTVFVSGVFNGEATSPSHRAR